MAILGANDGAPSSSEIRQWRNASAPKLTTRGTSSSRPSTPAPVVTNRTANNPAVSRGRTATSTSGPVTRPAAWRPLPRRTNQPRADVDRQRRGVERAMQVEEDNAAPRISFSRDNRVEKVTEVTPEQWNAMNAEQQAALTFNADLINAVNWDRENQATYDPTSEEREQYDTILKEMFGSTKNSQIVGLEYAPETLSLLSEMGISRGDTRDSSFADYLRLDVAITEEQVNAINQVLPPSAGPGTSNPNDPRFVERSEADRDLMHAQRLTGAQEALVAALAKGEQILTSMSGRAVNKASARLGGLPRGEDFSGLLDEDNQWLSYYMEALATGADETGALRDTGFIINEIANNMAERGVAEDKQAQLYRGLIEYATQAAEGQQEWYPDRDQSTIRSPQDVAAALGAGTMRVG